MKIIICGAGKVGTSIARHLVDQGMEVIGTFAYIKKGDHLYEFSKMAINPNQRGKGYGNIMMKYAISFAKKHKWKKIILYSNTILKNSIHLYRKYGFIEVKMEEPVIYSRGNIKMELDLL